MEQEEKKLKNIQAYIKNATDMVEVAVVEGRYYEEYQVSDPPRPLTEQKVLAELASHFRTQGFRVMLFQFDADSSQVSHNFLRIQWSCNPYDYPEEQSWLQSALRFFSKKSKRSSRIRLAGRAQEAYESVAARDTTTDRALEILDREVDHALLGSPQASIRKKDLERMLQPLGARNPLAKLNTERIIDHFEGRGYHVEVQRMFHFTFSRERGAAKKRRLS